MIELTKWLISIFYPYILTAKVVTTAERRHKNVCKYACCNNKEVDLILVIPKSGIAVITLNDGHKNIKITNPINFNVKVKYFYFYSPN